MTIFTRAEYLARIARTKSAMARKGLDTLLVASPANQFYLTGYDGWSFYTPQMVVVSMAAERIPAPVLVGEEPGESGDPQSGDAASGDKEKAE